MNIMVDFKKLWQFEKSFGALDGQIHIAIIKPQKSGSNYFDYKGFYSVVVSAIANSTL